MPRSVRNAPSVDEIIPRNSNTKLIMKINYCQLLAKLLVWLVAEVVLNYVGLDNLADYSEYLKEQSTVTVAVSYLQL